MAHPTPSPQEGRNPVGRPTRAPERREQILAAVEQSIVAFGLEKTTLARVAEIAEVPRSLIHHYLGNREALLQAAAERTVANVERVVREELVANPRSDPTDLGPSLDVLFGPRLQEPEISQLIEELSVAALRNPHLQSLLAEMHESWVSSLDAELAESLPESPPDRRRSVAHAIVGLVDAASRFDHYAFDPDNFRRMRAMAERLIEDLRRASTE